MKKTKKISAFLLMGFLIYIPLFAFGNEETGDSMSSHSKKITETIGVKKYKENQVIVKYKENVIQLINTESKRLAEASQAEKNLESEEVPELNIVLLKSATKTTEELISELENDPNVEYVEPNYIKEISYTPNDSNFIDQWGLNNTGQTGGTSDADIDASEAWDSENDTNKIVVAVLDTGVRYTHEDLANNMWDGSAGCNDENNNPIFGGCPNHGWDFENGDNDPIDDNGHGTFISGIIAGESGNAKGISGMSRYNDIEIMAIKVGSSSISTFDEIQGINFAKNNGANIINASFGGIGYVQSEKDAIDAFPGIFITSAGNGGIDFIGDDVDAIGVDYTPCDYTSSNIICVAATDKNDSLTTFSNYGNVSVDLGAPGSNIYSSHYSSDTTYGSGSGTSFSTPYVVGATALATKQFPTKNVSEIKDLIINSGDSISSLSGKTISGKRLNLNNSISDTTPPTRSNPAPSGVLASTTTSKNISLVTNENATCKYSTSSGVSYDSMSNTFSTTGGTSHSTNVSGLNAGNSYTYYIRCKDGDNNKNSNDFLINFSIDSDTTPPTLSSPSPSGALASTTISKNISLVTNKNATCKYSTSSGKSYDSMTNTFSSTGGKSHSTNVSGLNAGNSYTYYIRCKDGDNNKNSNDFLINFSIDSATSFPVYRFYSQRNNSHFYTISEGSKQAIIDKYNDDVWKYDGVAFYAYKTKEPGMLPVYRFYSKSGLEHFYTISESSKRAIIDKYSDDVWKYEGVAFYAYPKNPKTACQSGATPVYRFYSKNLTAHYFSTSDSEKSYLIDNYNRDDWQFEGTSFCVDDKNTSVELDFNYKTLPVYRFYSQRNNSHFYTISESSKQAIIDKYNDDVWKYDGVAFYAYKTKEPGMLPVYRFYSKSGLEHFYTISESSKRAIIDKYSDDVWKYEGVAFYAYPKNPKTACQSGATPVYRFYSKNLTAHYFSTSDSEKSYLIDNYNRDDWQFEGTSFCVDDKNTSVELDFNYKKNSSNVTIPVSSKVPNNMPNITVGLYEYTESELEDNSFRLKTDQNYIIKDKNGNKIATIPANTTTKVKYLNDSNHNLKIYDSIPEIITPEEITFEPADSSNLNAIFEIVRPEITYSKYRGKIKLKYSNNSGAKKIWVINELPLEQYVWGMGEITGTGPMEYNKVMTTAYRSYGLWKILHSTKYATEGFKVDATPGNQLYKGYEWETRYPRIREAAEMTKGSIVMYKNDIAIIPYSSWTDGRTRSFKERWGSTLYPWCQSVNDPYGDYNDKKYWDNSSYKSTSELEASGNHMVGISAHGALSLAYDHNWKWDRIIKYYLKDVQIDKRY